MSTQSVLGRVFALLLAAALSLPGVAWADPAAEAAEYYNQATTAYQSGEYQKAADLLDLAFGKNPDLVYKYNRILALQAAGDYQTALNDLNAMYSPMKADGQNRFEDVDDIKAQLEAAIAAKEKQEQPDPEDQKDPPDTGEQPDPIEPPPESGSGPNILGIGLTAGGGAMLVTGTLFATGILMPGDVKECLDGNCAPLRGTDRDESLEDTFEHAKSVRNTHRILAVSFLAGGAIMVGVGVVMLLSDGGEETTTTGLDSMRFSPYFAQDGGGAAFQMRF